MAYLHISLVQRERKFAHETSKIHVTAWLLTSISIFIYIQRLWFATRLQWTEGQTVGMGSRADWFAAAVTGDTGVFLGPACCEKPPAGWRACPAAGGAAWREGWVASPPDVCRSWGLDGPRLGPLLARQDARCRLTAFRSL